jgi:outer membrane protein assembly factor BamB
MVYRDSEREFLLTHGADYVVAHKLSDGSELWRCGGMNPQATYNPTLRFVASPAAADGLIVVPTAKNGPVLALRPDGKGDITDDTSRQVWRMPNGTPDVPSPIIHDGLVYLCRENGAIYCLDAASGEIRYKDKRPHSDRHRASPVLADGKLYCTAHDGTVSVVKAGPQYELLATNTLGEPMSASPVIVGGRVYLRTFEAIYAIGK